MHLDTKTIDAYLSRSFADDALRVLDEHVDSCLRCRLTVESAGLEPERWVRRGVLGRLVRVAPVVAASAALEERRAA
jgi:hypothetical protein